MRLNEILNWNKTERLMTRHFVCTENYELGDDDTIDVNGSITLQRFKINKLPVKFNNVSGIMFISDNELTTLEGCPTEIGGSFHCNSNQLTNLIGGPKIVGDNFYAQNNPLTSLEGLPKYIGDKIMMSYDKNLPLLRLCLVEGLTGVMFTNIDPTNKQIIRLIMHKYLGKGQKGAILCAAELTKLGFKGNARL